MKVSTNAVLSVRDLSVSFDTPRGVVRAVSDVGFDVAAGETVALVGESGSGKSVTALALLGMVRRPGRITGGSVLLNGAEVLGGSEAELRKVRGSRIAMVFQDPGASLNPVLRISDQITEGLVAHGVGSKREARVRALEVMELVGIPDPKARLDDHPHQFSGGMRQRVMIAMALAGRPDVLVADEPTTALDVTVQAQILDVLATVNRELGTAILLVTHNLGVVAQLCSRAMVMYGGRIVEQAPVAGLFASPEHPYTSGLIGATPRLSTDRRMPLVPIPGNPPAMGAAAEGCSFAPRCAHVQDRCRTETPPLLGVGPAPRTTASHTDLHSADTVKISVRKDGGSASVPDLTVIMERRAACWADGPFPVPVSEVFIDHEPGVAAAQVEHAGSGALLELRDVTKHFAVRTSAFGKGLVRSVDGVTLSVAPGETLGLVGESGCGKSTLGRLAVGIHPPTSGQVVFDGRDVAGAKGRDLKALRRGVQFVFQDPYGSLDPRMTIGALLREPLEVHGIAKGDAAKARVLELLDLVGLPAEAADRYPHEFSGGQRQRVAIARALAVEPRLIVLDEPVSALDVSLQAQVVNLLRELQDRLGLAYLFVAHDLAVVRHLSHRIAVMYLGQIVEIADAEELTEKPLHPYTAALLSAVPEPDPEAADDRERILLTGDVPSPLNPPTGCRFHGRCPIGPARNPDRTVCVTDAPPLLRISPSRQAACHFPGELA